MHGDDPISSAITIGATVIGGTATRVLFVGSTGLLDDDAGLTYNDTTDVLTVGGGIVVTAGQVLTAAGLVTAPSLCVREATTGFYSSAVNTLDIALNNANWYSFGAGTMGLRDTAYLGWSSTSSGTGTKDIVFSRDSASVLALAKDSTGSGTITTRMYNSGTNASGTYERLNFDFNVGVASAWAIYTSGAGGGLSRAFAIGTIGSSQATSIWVNNGQVCLFTTTAGEAVFTPKVRTSGAVTGFTVTLAANTGQTASTEVSGYLFDSTSTRQWATGALTLQREFRIAAPTYAFVGASTITDAVTFAVAGEPVAGTNATITRKWMATFGTLEATIVTPARGVGMFGAGTVNLIIRDTTNNVEGILESSSTGVAIGATSNHSVGLYSNNTLRWSVATTGALTTPAASTYQLLATDGSAGAPSLSFTGSPTYGIYLNGTAITVACGGAAKFQWGSGGDPILANNIGLAWSSTGVPSGATDTGFNRVSAAVVSVTSHIESAGDNSGNLGSASKRWVKVFAGPGSAASPSISIANVSGTANDGLYATGTAAIGVTTAGTLRVTIDSTGISAVGTVIAYSGTGIPAGGTAGVGLRVSSTSNFGVFFGSGAPSLSAAKGSIYMRSDGTTVNDRCYINTDGGTTWTAITTAA